LGGFFLAPSTLIDTVFQVPIGDVDAAEPNGSLKGKAKGAKPESRERFELARIFTQRRRDAEMLIGISDCVLRDAEIFGGPFTAKVGASAAMGLIGSSFGRRRLLESLSMPSDR
jgi:hypothetical protein